MHSLSGDSRAGSVTDPVSSALHRSQDQCMMVSEKCAWNLPTNHQMFSLFLLCFYGNCYWNCMESLMSHWMLLDLMQLAIVGVLQPANYNRPPSMATAPELYVETCGVIGSRGSGAGVFETVGRPIINNNTNNKV